MVTVAVIQQLNFLPEWLKAVVTHHYTPKEMVIIALVGFGLGMVYGWWVKKRLKQQKETRQQREKSKSES